MTEGAGVRVVSDDAEEVELLGTLSEAERPRMFAVYEVARAEGRLVDTVLCLWGLDLTEQTDCDSYVSGAVFLISGGVWGNADSAEHVLELFSMIRSEVRLVWL